jgi:hypothetical protein
LDKCGEYAYDVSIYVDSHLHAVASPKEEAVAAGCPFIVTHAVFDQSDGPGRKEILVWWDKEEAESLFLADGSFPIGLFKLSDLAQAYEGANPNADGAGVYDVLTNNCGTYMVSLGLALGVQINTKMTAFIARRLLEHAGQELIHSIRESAHSLVRWSHHISPEKEQKVSDDKLVELLVEAQVSPLLEN